MRTRLIITVAASSLLAGCWPTRYTYRPGVEGEVVSSVDGKPVANATIHLVVPRADLVPVQKVATGGDGKFQVRPYYQWGIDSFLTESAIAEGSIEITAPGYLPYRQDLKWSHTGPRTQELGVVRLSKP